MKRAGLSCLIVLAGCGSAPEPPAAGPPVAPVTVDGQTARLDVRARTLTVGGERVQAGVGPTSLAAGDGRLYVTDTAQDALLIFETRPDLHLQRRNYVAGGPVRVTVRGDRVAVELAQREEVVEFTADGRRRTR